MGYSSNGYLSSTPNNRAVCLLSWPLALCHVIVTHAGIDKWFSLTPIHKDDEVQGEILVEISIEQFGEVSESPPL